MHVVMRTYQCTHTCGRSLHQVRGLKAIYGQADPAKRDYTQWSPPNYKFMYANDKWVQRCTRRAMTHERHTHWLKQKCAAVTIWPNTLYTCMTAIGI